MSWLSDATGINIDIGGAISGVVNGIGSGLHDIVADFGAAFDRLIKDPSVQTIITAVAVVIATIALGVSAVIAVPAGVAALIGASKSGDFTPMSF